MDDRTPKLWMKVTALCMTLVFAVSVFTSCETSKEKPVSDSESSISAQKERPEDSKSETKTGSSQETDVVDPDIEKMKEEMTAGANTQRDWAEAYVKSLFSMYEKNVREQNAGLRFSEYEITEWKKVGTFDGIFENPKSEPLTVYLFDCTFRLEPKEKAGEFGFAGGGYVDEEGWFRKFLPMGYQYFVFRGTDQNAECIGILNDECSLERRADMERYLMNWAAERGYRSYRFESKNPKIAIVRRYNFRGEVDKFLLTQPAKYGEEGIWRIEYYMDRNGGIYPYMVSQEFQEMSFDPTLEEYAVFLQIQFDEGKKLYLNKPEEVVRHWHPFLGESNEYPLRVQEYFTVMSVVNAFTVFFQPDVQEIYGFVDSWDEENNFMDIDAADLLDESTDVGMEKLKILEIPYEDRKNGKYLYNPWSGPDAWAKVNEDSKFYVRNENGKLTEVSRTEFTNHRKGNGAYKKFWKFEIKGDLLISATEWEIPK